MTKVFGLLRLMRPANIVTSVADVLAGIAITGYFDGTMFTVDYFLPVFWLCVSTIGLYGGGVVFNDVFDAGLDRIERPERPIPKGIITPGEGAILGSLLLLLGVLAAFWVSAVSGWLAFAIAVAALVYNKWAKHYSVAGPLTMGLCRGLNLLLGISILIGVLYLWWFLALVPIVYIAAITMISRGEVHGGQRGILYFSSILYGVVIVAILVVSFPQENFPFTLLFLIFFGYMVFSGLIKAIRDPLPANLGKAVKAGVLGMIVMDAAWAAAFGAYYIAAVIIILLPVSLWLARKFAVT